VRYLSDEETVDLCNRTIGRCNRAMDAGLVEREDYPDVEYFTVVRHLAMQVLRFAELGEPIPRKLIDRMLAAVRAKPTV